MYFQLNFFSYNLHSIPGTLVFRSAQLPLLLILEEKVMHNGTNKKFRLQKR